MTDGHVQSDSDATFYAAEQAGLKLAIKGRIVALVMIGIWLVASRGQDRAAEFILAVMLFSGLGLLHFLMIGSAFDRRWVKYVFLAVDIVLLSTAVAVMPPYPEVDLPQIFMFRFNNFTYYFLILGVAAFSFSPGLVVWSGVLGAAGWLGAFLWVTSGMQNPLNWSAIPADPSRQQVLGVFLSEDFAAHGSRLQEAVIYLLVAVLIAIVVHRARRTVQRQLEAERESAAVSQMFGQFVPQAVADSMIKDEGALDPVERQATVLFIDVAGFTKLTEAKGPRAIVEIINAYFDSVTEIIGRHNGVVTQFLGDGVLAIFNVPAEDPDHAQHALDAATDLLDTVRKQTFAGEQLAIRVGLNTGPLIAGNVGGGGRQSYTVYGDTVNLAARLETLNKEHGTSLLASQSTADLVRNGGLRKIGESDVRGLSEPVGLYTLARTAADG